ncbi:MAG TPA: MFS transporter, partial [Actinoplanes sp.]|nr:MFS transporter [Actinoplanes sp.]
AAFMILLDVSIVNVALPSIERGLAVSAGSVQCVVSGYALTLGLALVPAGRLGDVLGRRCMFLIALAAFVVTSALTGAAPSIGLLIAARLLQGVAGGMLIPQNSGLIQELFRGDERGRAFGVLGATVGLATAAGPVVGGLILTAVSGPDAWRWLFYVNVPIGLVALVLAAPARTNQDRWWLAWRPSGPGWFAAARRWCAQPAAALGGGRQRWPDPAVAVRGGGPAAGGVRMVGGPDRAAKAATAAGPPVGPHLRLRRRIGHRPGLLLVSRRVGARRPGMCPHRPGSTR